VAHGGRRNGAGRPFGSVTKTTATFRDAAGKYDNEALETLASIMRNTEGEPSDRMTACSMLMDRAHGKPTAMLEATVKAFDPDELTDAELAAIIAEEGGSAEPEPAPADQDEPDDVVPPRRLRAGKTPKAAAKKTKRRRHRKDQKTGGVHAARQR
jgi:hypothetical protein